MCNFFWSRTTLVRFLAPTSKRVGFYLFTLIIVGLIRVEIREIICATTVTRPPCLGLFVLFPPQMGATVTHKNATGANLAAPTGKKAILAIAKLVVFHAQNIAQNEKQRNINRKNF